MLSPEKQYVFITGAYRSGTTLLHHLLDDHPDLMVFPVENCFIRDYLFSNELPNPRQRNLDALTPLIEEADYDGMIQFFVRHEKLGLALKPTLVLKGSTGNQSIATGFSMTRFDKVFRELLEVARQASGRLSIRDLSDSYTDAWFQSTNNVRSAEPQIIVNKCPDKGACIEYYLKHYPDAKVIHMERDPRAVVSSHKSDLPQSAIIPHRKMLQYIDVQVAALSRRKQFATSDRVSFIKYEDLVADPSSQMKNLVAFLGIQYDEILETPTVLGDPWHSNSSFSADRSDTAQVYVGNISKFQQKLNDLELRYIETFCYEGMKAAGYELLLISEADYSNNEHHASLMSEYSRRSFRSLNTFFARLKRKAIHIWRTKKGE